MIPNVSDVLNDFAQQEQFIVVTKTVSDFEVSESNASAVSFFGNFQPTPIRELLIKPEGQRTWKWYNLWTMQSLNLDDIVQDRAGKKYRVMSAGEWDMAGYYYYELAEQPNL